MSMFHYLNSKLSKKQKEMISQIRIKDGKDMILKVKLLYLVLLNILLYIKKSFYKFNTIQIYYSFTSSIKSCTLIHQTLKSFVSYTPPKIGKSRNCITLISFITNSY